MEGLVRTYAVFVYLPIHVEIRLSGMPVLKQGIVMSFDQIKIPSPVPGGRVFTVEGPHVIIRWKLVYSPVKGLSQYLEFEEVSGQN